MAAVTGASKTPLTFEIDQNVSDDDIDTMARELDAEIEELEESRFMTQALLNREINI